MANLNLAPVFQRVGEPVPAFVWRLEQAFNGELNPNVLAYKIIQGFTPNIRMAMPQNKVKWTVERLMWFGEHLDEFLPKTDPHWQESGKPVDSQVYPDFTVKVNVSRADLSPPSEKEVESGPLSSPSAKVVEIQGKKKVTCYRCQKTGHYAYEHTKKVKSIVQRVKPLVPPPCSSKKPSRRRRGQRTRRGV
jgi:hypothetical protein